MMWQNLNTKSSTIIYLGIVNGLAIVALFIMLFWLGQMFYTLVEK